MAGQGIAHIFQIARHVLLAVQVIGPHPAPGRFRPARVHHGRHHRPVRQLRLPQMQQAAPLDGQGMHRHAFRGQAAAPGQGLQEHLQRFPRQTGDQIHVDMMKAAPPGQGISALRLGGGVPPPDPTQGFIVHGLGVDGDAGGPVIPNHPQFFFVNGVRPARFHGHFPCPVNEGLGGGQHPIQQRRGQGSGRAAAHVKRPGTQSFFFQQFQCSRDFLFQSVHIGRQLLPFSHFAAQKGAVSAPGNAERNAHIQVHIPVIRFPDPPLNGYDFRKQACFFGQNIKDFFCFPCGFLQSQAPAHALVQQAGGPDAGQGTPGRRAARHPFHDFIQGLFDLPFVKALFQ